MTRDTSKGVGIVVIDLSRVSAWVLVQTWKQPLLAWGWGAWACGPRGNDALGVERGSESMEASVLELGGIKDKLLRQKLE
jgi:hypothetical protein